MRSLENFFKVFNSSNFSVINPFLNVDRFEALKKVAGEALLKNKLGAPVSPLYHFSGAFINYREYKFSLAGSLTNSAKQLGHPALVWMPSWFREEDISYWLKNEVEFIQKIAESALEHGIDPVYVPNGLCLRLICFTSGWAFRRWCAIDDLVNIGKRKLIGDSSYYTEILRSGRGVDATISVAPQKYPLVVKDLVLFSETQPQYISSVPLDVPLSWFDSKLLFLPDDKVVVVDGKNLFIPNDFYTVFKNNSSNKDKPITTTKTVDEFFDNKDIKNYHCREGSSYSDQVTHYAGFKEDGLRDCAIDIHDIILLDS